MKETFTLLRINQEMMDMMILSFLAFIIAMMLTPVYTFLAYRYKFWKKQREHSTTGEKLEVFTKLHAQKFTRNIPTMAGIIGVLTIVIVTVFFNLDSKQTWLPLAALVAGGLVGLIDDVINIRGKGKGVAGLRSSLKFIMITAVAAALAWWFFTKITGASVLHIPFIGGFELGWIIVPLFVLVVVATSNAVNISDGLDGLAGGLLLSSYGAFGVIALFEGYFALAGFCLTVVGALLSYVWFNIFPARFFMGDVGSFAFGTGLGVVAMQTNTLFLLPIIGLVFVLEGGSSLVQIASKRLRHGKRVFIAAPIHHHLEAIGWPEPKVTMRFWVIGAVMAIIGVFLALAGGNV